jgi:RNA recognition motif-containing protein
MTGGHPHDAAKDLVTVFVSNLLYSINEDRLKELFFPVSRCISLILHLYINYAQPSRRHLPKVLSNDKHI